MTLYCILNKNKLDRKSQIYLKRLSNYALLIYIVGDKGECYQKFPINQDFRKIRLKQKNIIGLVLKINLSKLVQKEMYVPNLM